MAIDDLMKAFGAFNQGLQEFAINRGISQATDQLAQINQAAVNENEKKTQQLALANQLSAHLVGLGANAQQVAQAANAFKPHVYGSAEEAMQMGDMPTAQRMQEFTNKPLVERQQAQFKQQSEEAIKQRQHEIDLQRLKNKQEAILKSLQAKGQKVSEGELAFRTNVGVALDTIDKLDQAIGADGTYESEWFGNADTAAIIKGAPYQIATMYTKIVDPATAAREGEVASALQYLTSMGITANDKVARAKLKMVKESIQNYQQKRLESADPAFDGTFNPNRSVSKKLAEELSAEDAKRNIPLPPGIPKGSKLEVKKHRSGKLQKVYVAPNGEWFIAE